MEGGSEEDGSLQGKKPFKHGSSEGKKFLECTGTPHMGRDSLKVEERGKKLFEHDFPQGKKFFQHVSQLEEELFELGSSQGKKLCSVNVSYIDIMFELNLWNMLFLISYASCCASNAFCCSSNFSVPKNIALI